MPYFSVASRIRLSSSTVRWRRPAGGLGPAQTFFTPRRARNEWGHCSAGERYKVPALDTKPLLSNQPTAARIRRLFDDRLALAFSCCRMINLNPFGEIARHAENPAGNRQ